MTYFSAAEKEIPVPSGEIWQVGWHWFMCSDLVNDLAFREALTSCVMPVPTLVYSDPPWGQALAHGFRTKAGYGRATYHWTEIYREIADLAEEYDVPLWVDGSKRDSAIGMLVPGAIERRNTKTERGYWDVTYFGGKPSGLYYAHSAPHPPLTLTSNKGFEVTAQVLKLYKPGIVLDPCGGLGGIPLTAEKAGWGSVSNELSSERIDRAIARMAKQTGLTPERVA